MILAISKNKVMEMTKFENKNIFGLTKHPNFGILSNL
jgi:hypothetical protein